MMEKAVLETKRLMLRKMCREDQDSLNKMLQDPEVMYAYAHAFSDREAKEWLERQLERYRQYGFGLWAVILKETGEFIGQCGLTMQDCRGEQVLEVGYLFCKEFWHQGYAAEAATACRDYAFEILNAGEVYSIIRDNNTASRNVAKRNGMKIRGSFVKHYYGIDMPHDLFCITREEFEAMEK